MQLKLEKTLLGCRLEIHECTTEHDEDVLIAGVNKLCQEPYKKIELHWMSEAKPTKKIRDFMASLKSLPKKYVIFEIISGDQLKELEAQINELDTLFKSKSGPEILDLKSEITFLRSRIADLDQMIGGIFHDKLPLSGSPAQTEISSTQEELRGKLAPLFSAQENK